MRSSAPEATPSSRSDSSSSSRISTRTSGQRARKRPTTPGRMRAPADWNVPTRIGPRFARDELIEIGAQGAEAREQAIGVPEHHLARLGQRHRARPARALDQLQADGALERRDLLRDGRLRVAEALGRFREGALLGDCLERRQMARLDSDESISRHDRFQSLSVFPLSIAQADTTEGSQSVKAISQGAGHDQPHLRPHRLRRTAGPCLASRCRQSHAQLVEPTQRLARAGPAKLTVSSLRRRRPSRTLRRAAR